MKTSAFQRRSMQLGAAASGQHDWNELLGGKQAERVGALYAQNWLADAPMASSATYATANTVSR